MMKILVTILASFLAALPGALLAAEGAAPIWQPTTITQPGKYILTRNVNASSVAPVITIAASNVDLDLNGFTITQTTNDSVVIRADDVNGLSIHSGTITGNGGRFRGIVLSNVTQFAVRRILFNGDTERPAIDTAASSSGVIENNLIYNFEPGMRLLTASAVVLRDNVLWGNDGGIQLVCSGCTVSGNTLTGAVQQIDLAGTGSKIHDNTLDTLFVSGTNTLILDNVFTGSLWVSGQRNHIEGNLINSDLSLQTSSSGNVYRRNTAAAFSDSGTNNKSHGDNYMPNQM
jgi:hypothetical protein